MAGFIQIIEYTTTRFDEVEALGRQMEESQRGKSNARRVQVTADRDRPNTYLTIVEFDSYESAADNSAKPETQQFAEQMGKLCDGPPKFYNLDVRQTFSMG